jgi:hypothetical protein
VGKPLPPICDGSYFVRADQSERPPTTLHWGDLSPSLFEFQISGSGVTELFRLGSPNFLKFFIGPGWKAP